MNSSDDRNPAAPQPEVGSLYLDYDGNAYRLIDYGLDPLTERHREAYAVNLVKGAASTAMSLPEGARLVWSPSGGPR